MKQLALLFLMLVFQEIFGQRMDQIISNVIPPSPNAASLGKFIENPVGLYTGTPNINVPIYQLELGSLKLPISLSYHSSGLKVDDISSWVGAGWALNAGGVLSRTIRGRADEDGFFIGSGGSLTSNFFDGNLPQLSKVGCSTNQERIIQEMLVNGCIDTQSDIYFFSTPSVSGKFLYKRDKSIMLMPYQAVSVIGGPDNINGLARWEVLGEDGIKYVFGTAYNSQTNYRELTSVLPQSGITPCGNSPVALSSWHLVEMISQNRADTILFEYAPVNIEYSSQNILRYEHPIPDTYPNFPNPVINSKTTINGWQLSKISTRRGDLILFSSDDLERSDLKGGKRLKEIEIYKNGSLLKSFSFTHDYFEAFPKNTTFNYENYYLYLKEVREYNKDRTESLYPYSFEYNYQGGSDFPNRATFNHDLFGFFNGNINSNPVSVIAPPNEDKAQLGVLKKIKFPTGGQRTFKYELHDYSNLMAQEFEQVPLKIVYSSSSDSFTIPKESRGFIKWRLVLCSEGGCSFSIVNTTTQTGVWSATWNANPVGEEAINLPPGNYRMAFARSGIRGAIEYGTLELDLTYNSETILVNKKGGGLRVKQIEICDGHSPDCMSYSYSYKEGTSNKSSGILRGVIKNQYDIYFDNFVEFGLICNPPVLMYNEPFPPILDIEKYAKFRATNRKAYHNSTNTEQGANVCYSEVTEFVGISVGANFSEAYGTNGKTITKFTNYGASDNQLVTALPLTPYYLKDYQFGQVSSIEQYKYKPATAEFECIKKTINTYDILHKESARSLVSAKLYNSDCPYGCTSAGAKSWIPPIQLFVGNIYEEYSGRSFLTNTKEYENVNGVLTLFKTIDYAYTNPNHLQLTREDLTGSKGEHVITEYYYPMDQATSTSAISFMNAQNIKNALIEKIIKNGNAVTDKVRVNYDVEEGVLVKRSIETAKMGGPYYTYQINADFNKYGLPLQSANIDGINNSFLWGYKNTLPIAQVKNAASNQIRYTSFEEETVNITSVSKTGRYGYASTYLVQLPAPGTYKLTYWRKIGAANWELVETIVTSDTSIGSPGTVIDEVRLYPVGAEVTTFTYDPGVGLTSQTDSNNLSTTYEYDLFGRLILIRDDKGSILKTFSYHYRARQ